MNIRTSIPLEKFDRITQREILFREADDQNLKNLTDPAFLWLREEAVGKWDFIVTIVDYEEVTTPSPDPIFYPQANYKHNVEFVFNDKSDALRFKLMFG